MSIKELLAEYNALPEYSGLELVDVNQISLFGDRPIHIASVKGSLRDLNLLIDNGADVNSIGEHGYTPLHHAVEQGHKEVIELLLKNGADSCIKNSIGLTPFE